MKNVNRILIAIITVFLFSPQLFAQQSNQVRITSSPNPLGAGARAMGYGNAFIAVADDSTAASWNPAGLMQLETSELSVVGYYSSTTEDYTSKTHPESSGKHNFSTTELNYFSAAYPFKLLNKNMVLSLNYQRMYDLNRKLNLTFNGINKTKILDDQGNVMNELESNYSMDISYQAKGGINVLSPAYAVQITEDFSLGLTLNFWKNLFGGKNGWMEEYRADNGRLDGIPNGFTMESINEYKDISGVNFNLGLLWNITEKNTIGAVFKSPARTKLKHHSNVGNKEETMELQFPLSYGLGLAHRFSDAFTLAFDCYRTEWSRYYLRDGTGNKTSPLDGRNKDDSHVLATTQFHLGAEYLFILEKTVIPLRGGVFLDPEPVEDRRTENYYGLALGSGISLGKIILDLAYQYRFGQGVEGDTIGIADTKADVFQHTVYLSAIYHF